MSDAQDLILDCRDLRKTFGDLVAVDGRPLTTRSVDAKRAIGYVPQDLAIYPDLTGRENLIFSLGAAGTGMLMGSVFKNDQQAGGMGVMLGIGLAALGGCMVPLFVFEMFSPTLYQVAHITPHAWGVKAFEEIILYDGGIADIQTHLAV